MDPLDELAEVMANSLFARKPARSDEFLVDVDIESIDSGQRHAVQIRVEEFAESLLALELDAHRRRYRRHQAAIGPEEVHFHVAHHAVGPNPIAKLLMLSLACP